MSYTVPLNSLQNWDKTVLIEGVEPKSEIQIRNSKEDKLKCGKIDVEGEMELPNHECLLVVLFFFFFFFFFSPFRHDNDNNTERLFSLRRRVKK